MAMSQLNEEFDALAEAKKLRNAYSLNEATIIKIFVRRPSHQRVEIAKAFKTSYGMELVEKLKTKIRGSFLDTCRGLCYDLREYDAMCLRDAVEGVGKKEQTMIDILTTRSNDQINAIKTAYNTIYNRNLDKDIYSVVRGDLRQLLVILLTANRDETVKPDPEVVKLHVVQIYEAWGSKSGTPVLVLNRILCTRSFQHVAAVADLYSKEYDESLSTVINRETSGSYRDCLNSIVSFATDPVGHFAEVIYKCVQGAGKNDRRLQHTIITQCEGDMQGIKNAMERLHQISLKELVKKNKSGNYRELLLALIG